MIVEPQEQAAEDFASLEPQAIAEAPTPEPQTQEAAVEADLPEKYKGKSVAELARMHEEAQRFISKQANEVHEVRKLADDLIKRQLNAEKVKPTQTEVEPEVDFFENPQEAVNRAVENNPTVKEARQAAAELARMKAAQKLAEKHPDFATISQDAGFIDWVKASPIRMGLYAKADSSFDFDSADELLSTFKALKQVSATQASDEGKKQREQQLRAASVDVGGTGETSKKIYRRADIMRLMNTDPDRYQMMQPEILAAYAERRVR